MRRWIEFLINVMKTCSSAWLGYMKSLSFEKGEMRLPEICEAGR